MTRSKNYTDLLIESLKDPQEAAGYLNVVLQEANNNSEESNKLILMALKNITQAQ